MASQRKTSLVQCFVRFEAHLYTMTCLPISNIDDIIPLLLDPCLQESFKPRDPRPAESPPHLFWLDV